MAALLLLAAYTGQRPTALLSIRYTDIELFVQRDVKTGKTILSMLVQLTNVKGQRASKDP